MELVRSMGRWSVYYLLLIGAGVMVSASVAQAQVTPLPTPSPQPGGYGLEATKKQPAPTQGASITVPGNGAGFTTSPIDVRGICPDGLLVQIYNNAVMVGSVMCEGGSFSLQVSLFAGDNELTAVVFDDLGQAGPTSAVTKVTYTNTNFTAFGQLVTLTSTYGRRSAAAGVQLDWPLQLSGGAGPYAFSIDWGDASQPQLLSQAVAGTLNIRHAYKNAGIYQVSVRVTDVNNVTAFLQLVAVSNGQPVAAASDESDDTTGPSTTVLWLPAAVSLVFLPITYWLGRRSQIVSLRNKMLHERDKYQDK